MRERSKDDGFALEFGQDGSEDPRDAPDAGVDVLEDALDEGEADDEGPWGMTPSDVAEFRGRWADIQASFIDDPHRACEHADNLVDLVLSRLTERFARERKDLVLEWDRGHEVTDTEVLRQAMKGYRSLIDRLLAAEL